MDVFLNEYEAREHVKQMLDMLPKGETAKIAVAFWGRGAIDFLGLNRDGLKAQILCNLDSGACNPDEIRTLMKLPGIKLRSHPKLHAKVYWTPRQAVVGSSNASTNGLASEYQTNEPWKEANINVSDKKTLEKIDNWFDEVLWNDPKVYDVDDKSIERAEHLWKRRQEMAPTGERLYDNIYEAFKHSPEHSVWDHVKVAYWKQDLDDDAMESLNNIKRELGLNENVSAYSDWNDDIHKKDLIIDFDNSTGKPRFTGIWEALNRDSGENLRVVEKVKWIDLGPFGQLKLDASTKNYLKQLGRRFSDNHVISFAEAVKGLKQTG
jgi:HKD family nuclease